MGSCAWQDFNTQVTFTMATSSYTDTEEEYFVQSQPLIQYGPLTLDQLKELYIHEVVDDNTYITTSSSLASFEKSKKGNNAFHILPNQEPLWSPINAMDSSIYNELEEAMTPYT